MRSPGGITALEREPHEQLSAHQLVRLALDPGDRYHPPVLQLCLCPRRHFAQNLGKQPATGQAVQGEQASQPEGAFLNLVNWIGNVICPVGAALAIVGCVISWRQGRGFMPWALTAGGLLAVSALRDLVEFFIANGQQIG